ncbi:MAG: hypothetical protein SV760_08050, partial [Halobacteria archaeon]|nr:hypothetical protein [Halobacteria archaeon]
HPFFFGTQFHPEFRSRPRKPSPPFVGFVGAALETEGEGTGSDAIEVADVEGGE